ncbi:glutathione S-transferase family protein [Pseudahrensia aquimaris]|uniref:Glutathione S-transferase family protein n=1 Tax=Pseudahrensia aquimaris TaxID=744461 RepID=A0ABW3FIN4_9HYPH
MSDLHLVIANKLYSSWSLRAWLLLRAFDIPFRETVIAMYKPDTREKILAYSPTGKVPVLMRGDMKVWESLAIVESVAEWFPDKAIWPTDEAARAHARAAASEMHAGFMGLRSACPMNLTKTFLPKDRGDAVVADVQRLGELWGDARNRFGADGPYLYGGFSAADAMFAPVVSRLRTYGIEISPQMQTYADAVWDHPAFVQWRAEAFEEPWFVAHYEEGETPLEVLVSPAEERAA